MVLVLQLRETQSYLKHHRGIESNSNTLDYYASFVGPHISKKGLNIYNWLELIFFEDLPLSFVDHPMVRKHCKMASISSKWLRKIFLRVGYLVTQKIAKKLPKSFSLMIDGWTAPHCLDHYVGVIALYTENGELKCPVLACSPMESIAKYLINIRQSLVTQSILHTIDDFSLILGEITLTILMTFFSNVSLIYSGLQQHNGICNISWIQRLLKAS